MRRAVVLAVFVLASCKQTRREAWEKVCEAHVACCAGKTMDPAERATKAWQWIEANVDNEEVMKDLRSLGSIESGPDKDEILAMTVKEAGLDPKACAMLRD